MERILSKTKIGNKTYNLREDNMPRAASFEHNDMGHECTLIPCEDTKDEHTRMLQRVPNTGCTIKFKGGKLSITNRKLFQLIMDSSAYKSNRIRIDPEDPSGFWREAGALTVRSRAVLETDRPPNPGVDAIDLSKIKVIGKDEVVLPVVRI